MIGEFKLVHLVGSTRGNEKVFSLIEKELTKAGFIVFKPVFYIKEDYIDNKEVVDRM